MADIRAAAGTKSNNVSAGTVVGFVLFFPNGMATEETLLGTCWRQCVLYEDEDCLLSAELDALPYHIHKLSNCEVGRDKVPASNRILGLGATQMLQLVLACTDKQDLQSELINAGR